MDRYNVYHRDLRIGRKRLSVIRIGSVSKATLGLQSWATHIFGGLIYDKLVRGQVEDIHFGINP